MPIYDWAIAHAESDTETNSPCTSSQHGSRRCDYSTWNVDPTVWHDKTSKKEKEVR
jgi:hypothetical protein